MFHDRNSLTHWPLGVRLNRFYCLTPDNFTCHQGAGRGGGCPRAFEVSKGEVVKQRQLMPLSDMGLTH